MPPTHTYPRPAAPERPDPCRLCPSRQDGAAVFGVPFATAAPLPVLAVSPAGLRRVGLVVLDRRSRLRTAKLPFLRHHKDHGVRLDVILREVAKLLVGLNVACLALDAGVAQRPCLAGLRQALRRLCREENVWLREVPLAGAMHFLGDDDRGRLALSLAADYRELAKRLDFSGRNPLGPIARAREQRPLIDAFILAHAIAVDARAARPAPARTAPSTL